MHSFLAKRSSLVVLLLFVHTASGQEPSAKEIVEKAVKAHGGLETLSKYKGTLRSGKGTFYGLGDGVPFSGDWTVQEPKQVRVSMQLEVDGQPLRVISVVNGDKAWLKINDDEAMELPQDEVDEENANLYTGWVTGLAPLLNEKGFKLDTLGEVKVKDEDAYGVRVSKEGQREVRLYFSKKSGMLIKSEATVKDNKGGGGEMTQATFYSDYKGISGVQQAMQVYIERDGKRFVDVRFSSTELVPLIDPGLFVRP